MKKYFSGFLLFVFWCIFSICAFAYNDGDLVVTQDSIYSDITVSGDLYVMKDKLLMLAGDCVVEGDIYVYGMLGGDANLNCKGTLNCLYCKAGSISLSAGDQYDFGRVVLTGHFKIRTLNVTDSYLPDDMKLPDPNAPAPHVHTWTKMRLDKESCTSGWTEYYVCFECGESKTEPVTPGGHVLTDWYTTEPNCFHAGKKWRYCLYCDYREEVILPKVEHEWGDWHTKEATCVDAGEKYRICTNCRTKDSIKIPVNDAAHIWGSWSLEQMPSCTSSGFERRTCSKCGRYEDKELPQYTHDWGIWWTDDPDCAHAGEKYRFCSRCGKKESIELPATGIHLWGDWITDTNPGCVSGNGMRHRKCDICNARQEETIKPYGAHLFGPWETYQKSSCIIRGLAVRSCSRCDAYEDMELPLDKNAHYCKKWKVTKKATALSAGKKTGKCLDCGKKVTVKIPKLNAKVSLNKKSLTLRKKKTATLKIKVKAYGDKLSSWKSSNKRVATVNSKGKVTAKGKGKAIITLRMRSGVMAVCAITVR